jgi:hypothetical protein
MYTAQALGYLDLRTYCSEAVLATPIISNSDRRRIKSDPPKVQSTLRCLPTRGDRALKTIVRIEAGPFNAAVKNCEYTLASLV